MKIVIHGHQMEVADEIVAYLRKHLVPLQRMYDSPAAQLTVYVEDAKPGKGGVDQACKLTLHMPRTKTLRVESVKEDLHAALLECVQRLKRLVQREVQKARTPARTVQQNPLGRSWRDESEGNSGLAPDGTPSTL